MGFDSDASSAPRRWRRRVQQRFSTPAPCWAHELPVPAAPASGCRPPRPRRAGRLRQRPQGDRPDRGRRARHPHPGPGPEGLRGGHRQPLPPAGAGLGLEVHQQLPGGRRDQHRHRDRPDEGRRRGHHHGRPRRREGRVRQGHRGHLRLVRPGHRRQRLVLRRGHHGVRRQEGQHGGLLGGRGRRRAGRAGDAGRAPGRRRLRAGVPRRASPRTTARSWPSTPP